MTKKTSQRANQQGKSGDKPILSVSELNQYARGCLEMQVGKVMVTGEISNFSCPASGHWYFTLKDSNAQIRCAMFRGKNQFIRSRVQNGMQVLLNGSVSIYEARGDYQMIVDYLEESGIGAMQRQFELLKAKLSKEGLFDSQHKKQLPKFAEHIAVITSRTGAAVHDIIEVIQNRQPSLKVTVIAAQVQGEAAITSLLQALQKANTLHQHLPLDAVIIGRGGGSLEDLWAFNDEQLARAVFAFPAPVISAVGHEVDFSICDYVADIRAATPSQAAELISIDQQVIEQQLDQQEAELARMVLKHISQQRKELSLIEKALKHPGEKLAYYQEQFSHSEQQLSSALQHRLKENSQRLAFFEQQLKPERLKKQLQQFSVQLKHQQQQLLQGAQTGLKQKQQALAQQTAQLDLVSPLATLQRGYAINEKTDGSIVRDSRELNIGDTLTATFAQGSATATVTNLKHKN